MIWPDWNHLIMLVCDICLVRSLALTPAPRYQKAPNHNNQGGGGGVVGRVLVSHSIRVTFFVLILLFELPLHFLLGGVITQHTHAGPMVAHKDVYFQGLCVPVRVAARYVLRYFCYLWTQKSKTSVSVRDWWMVRRTYFLSGSIL